VRELSSLPALRVLLVETSVLQAKIVTAALGTLGIKLVTTVDGGQSALASMAFEAPDLVISALYLPDMTGIDLVTRMREDPSQAQIAFILLSSETRPQVLEPVRQCGICSILPKPFAVQQLKRALEATLDFLQPEQTNGFNFHPEELRVLLVDDSPSARKFIRRVLSNLGVQKFLEAENGHQAAQILNETMVDLVVTDYNMPEMDGHELVDHIRQRSWQQSVPVLMVTSEQDNGRLAAVQEAGVSGICDKPFEPSVVRRLLQQIFSEQH
jgi:two-component system chemotaxis response regulator CheY